MGWKRVAGVCLTGALMSSMSFAGPTGLASIPIADILGHREFFAEYGVIGYDRDIQKHVDHYFLGTFGVGDRLEFGFDNDTLGGTYLHAKLGLAGGEKWQVSGGFRGLDVRDFSGEVYAMGRYDLLFARLHAGAAWDQHETRGMFGVDFPLGPVSMSVDHITGDFSRTWAMASYAIPKTPVNLNLAYGIPGRKSDGDTWFASLTWYGRF